MDRSSETAQADGPAWAASLEAPAGTAFIALDIWPLLELACPAPEVQEAAWSDRQWRADAARVARDPLDTQAHARRVLLQCHADAQGDAQREALRGQRLFSALVDLYLALGNHGPELRAALLTRARAVLAPQQHAFLARHLASGMTRHEPLPDGLLCVLSRAVVGRTDLVTAPRPAAASTHRAALEEAIDLIDRGDTATAQRLLEEALLAQPDDDEVAEELGQIYRLNGDDAAARNMAAKLRERGVPVPPSWPAQL